MDYPPSEKYRDGYEENKSFLSEINDRNYIFNRIEVIYQEKNLGSFANMVFLFGHEKNYKCIHFNQR